MPNLHLISNNSLFFDDIQNQIALYAPEFSVNAESAMPDVVVVDGKTIQISVLKSKFPHTPIFVFVKKGDDKPADTTLVKFVSKPLQLNEFLNRLRAAINLAANSDAGHLNFNKYELRPLGKEIINTRNGEKIKLTEKEVAILQYLHKIRGRIVTKSELLQQVWGYNPDVTTHTIETHIYRLRQKVEHDDASAQLIMTEDGGYVLKR